MSCVSSVPEPTRSMKARVPERAIVPQRLGHVVAAHADAIVLDGDLLVFGIGRNRDARLGVVVQKFRAADGFEAQLFASVGRVGNQFAQEDVPIGIDRMHHHVQQPRNIRLERPGFRRFRIRRHSDFATLFIRPPRRGASGTFLSTIFNSAGNSQVPARPMIS